MDREELLRLRYEESLAQRRLHPQLIWTRNSFFLLAQTALLAVAASQGQGEPDERTALISAAGLFTALIWVWVNLAGRALQRRWRKLVTEAEADLFSCLDAPPITGPFAGAAAATGEGRSFFVSITTALILLAAGFVVIWSYLLLGAL